MSLPVGSPPVSHPRRDQCLLPELGVCDGTRCWCRPSYETAPRWPSSLAIVLGVAVIVGCVLGVVLS